MFKTALLATLGVMAGLAVVSIVGTVVGTGIGAAEEAYNKFKNKKENKVTTVKEVKTAKT